MTTPLPEGKPPGLVASLRQLLSTMLSMAHTRLALASVEIEEELQRLIGLLLGMVGVLVFGMLGLLMLTLTVVLAVDAAQRVVVLAVFALTYLAIGGWFWWRIRCALATRPPFLHATLAEMAKDGDALQVATAPAAQAEAAP